MLDWVETVLIVIYFLLSVWDKAGEYKWRYKEPKRKEPWQARIKRERPYNSDYSFKRKRW